MWHFLTTRPLFQDRKQILKVLKPHAERMCLDDEAQLVLFTALDVTECAFINADIFYDY